jgi:hypothetical protein
MPLRCSSRATVERARCSTAAIFAAVIRFERRSSRAICPFSSCSRVGERCSRELRSANPSSPSSRNRRSHLYTVRVLIPAALAVASTDHPSSSTRFTSIARPAAQVRAQGWMFIRFFPRGWVLP